MTDLIFLFGGQSSRDDKMLERLTAVDPDVGQKTKAIVGDLNFSSNRGIQTAVSAVTLGWLEILNARGFDATQSAGLSLGEYAHLVDIGSLTAGDCRALVTRRGELYDEGPSGSMAAIFPCSWDELEPIVADVPSVEPAVFNSPTQTVVGGDPDGVNTVMATADEALFTMSVIVEDKIPMHTSLFEPVAQRFQAVLEETKFTDAKKPYWPNVSAEPFEGTPDQIRDALTRHVFQPVQWRATIDRMVDAYPGAVFIEVGPRTVLRDLMKRRWHPGLAVFATDSDGDPKQAFEAMLLEVERCL